MAQNTNTNTNKKAPMDWDRLADAFQEAYLKRCSEKNIGITDIDCSIDQDNVLSSVKVEVKVYGLAGAPAREAIHNKATGAKNKDVETIGLSYGSNKLVFVLDDSYSINANDYTLTYKLAA